MEPRTIFIDAHAMRRHERVSALKECFAGGVLIQVGWSDWSSTDAPLVSVLALVVGLAMLWLGVVELKRGKKFGSWVRWFDIFVGGLLVLEAYSLAAEGHHHATLIYGYYGLGVVYVILGVFHTQLGRRRYVRMDDDGVQVRMTPFRHFHLGWPDISRVIGHAASIEIFAKEDQRYEISRRYIPNLDEIRDLMLERASGRGIATK